MSKPDNEFEYVFSSKQLCILPNNLIKIIIMLYIIVYAIEKVEEQYGEAGTYRRPTNQPEHINDK